MTCIIDSFLLGFDIVIILTQVLFLSKRIYPFTPKSYHLQAYIARALRSGAGAPRTRTPAPYGLKLTRLHVFFYHPQLSCGKVMFSQASVILSIGGGVTQHALEQTPPRQTHTHTPCGPHPLGRHPPVDHTPWAVTPHGQTPSHGPHSLGRHTSPPEQTPPWADAPTHPHPHPRGPHPRPRDSHCSARYASYWNAFLFLLCCGGFFCFFLKI